MTMSAMPRRTMPVSEDPPPLGESRLEAPTMQMPTRQPPMPPVVELVQRALEEGHCKDG